MKTFTINLLAYIMNKQKTVHVKPKYDVLSHMNSNSNIFIQTDLENYNNYKIYVNKENEIDI